MRVLHVCNKGGVASVVAKFMDRLFGTESLVVERRIFDPFGVTTYGEVWDCGARMFALRCLWLARKFDIVHVHSFDKLVTFLKILYPHKPVIIHYHGSDIRGKWSLKQKYWSKADEVLYSTRDLLDHETPKNAVHIPNPVDTNLFYPKPGCNRKPKSALAFRYYLDEKKAMSYGLQLTFLEREIPYKEMPEILNRYEYYVDRTEIPSLSKTALEALACGLKVIRWDGEIVQGLPIEHKPENVIKQVWQIYDRLRRDN